MATIEINDLTSVGLIKDQPGYMLPPEAWTTAFNVRYNDGAVEPLLGYKQVFGTPSVAPYFAMPLVTANTIFWLYMGLEKAYVYDGTNHTNITRQSGMADEDYNGSNAREINGCILGGIPIINNGIDIPQFWATPDTGTDLADLTNWDSTRRCRVMRTLGSFLVALNITESGTNYGHQVLWSHPAEPGSVPSSWDETDNAVDAGLNELPDVNSGVIVDAGNLRGSLYIYKGTSTWRMTFVQGSRYIFDFKAFSETSGILAPRCWTTTSDGLRHVVLSQDDLVVHDGNRMISLLDKKMRKTLFNAIDPSNYLNCFLFDNPRYNEVWVCYPELGETVASRALIWNYKEGGISEADCSWQWAVPGEFQSIDTEQWADGSDTWAEDTGPWNIVNRKQVILVSPVDTKFFNMDSGNTRDGTAFSVLLQRLGLSVLGKTRTGDWIVDHEQWKLFKRLWLKVRDASVDVRIGSQRFVDGSVTWSASKTFDPLTQMTVDAITSGRAISLEFSSESTANWKLDGYKVDVERLGTF